MIKDLYPLENRLKEFRISLGLSQEDVAKRLGMDCTDRLSHWEKGKAMTNITNIFKLSILYGTNPEILYEELWNNINLEECNKV